MRFAIRILALSAALPLFLIGSTAHAGILFSDDFEGLSLSPAKWSVNITGGFVALDPLNSSNHVLDFAGRTGGGDVFSTVLTLTPGVTYTFSWDYLGTLPDAGGAAGLNWGSRGNAATELWVGATDPSAALVFLISNDGKWHHYSFDFTTVDTAGFTSVEVKFENYDGFGSSLHSALFDNVRVETAAAAPVPSTLVMSSILFGMFGVVWSHRRLKQTAAAWQPVE